MLRSLFGRAAEDDADAEHFDHWQTTDLCWSAGAERRTTLMLKNVGYALTQEGLLATIERRHRGAFDYLYLPMDFERGQNRGFAFVNFITPRGVPNFYEEFHGHPLTESSANRRVEIIFADVQGKEENLRESARYRPACFVSDGSHRREM